MQKVERSLTVNRVTAVKEFDVRSLAQTKLVVKPANLGILIRDPLIRRHEVMLSAFHHERTWKSQIGHFGVIGNVSSQRNI